MSAMRQYSWFPSIVKYLCTETDKALMYLARSRYNEASVHMERAIAAKQERTKRDHHD